MNIQPPLADIEIVSWDSSLRCFLRSSGTIKKDVRRLNGYNNVTFRKS